jgi:large subunit ribosomal protein L25
MSTEYIINAEQREDQGKGASRRLRRDGLVPGIVYGAGKEPVAITVRQNELVKSLEQEAFYSQVLTLKLGKDSEQVVLRDLQRHPAKPTLLHLDLQRINANEKLHAHIPLHFINEETCVGVKQGGGNISHVVIEVEVTCLPKDLPEYIEVDVADLNLGDALHLSDLKLPANVELVELAHEHDNAVVTVHKARAAVEVEEEVAAPAAEEGGEEAAGE